MDRSQNCGFDRQLFSSIFGERSNITPSGFACHPSTGEEWFACTVFVSLVVMQNTTPSGFACQPSTGEEWFARTVFVSLAVMQNTTPSGFACQPSTGEEWFARTVFVSLVVMQNTIPSGFACHPSIGGEWFARTVFVSLVVCRIPPRQASPPGADTMQSPQCVCTRHLPSIGGEYHPVRLRMQPSTGGGLSSPTVREVLFQQPGLCFL